MTNTATIRNSDDCLALHITETEGRLRTVPVMTKMPAIYAVLTTSRLFSPQRHSWLSTLWGQWEWLKMCQSQKSYYVCNSGDCLSFYFKNNKDRSRSNRQMTSSFSSTDSKQDIRRYISDSDFMISNYFSSHDWNV